MGQFVRYMLCAGIVAVATAMMGQSQEAARASGPAFETASIHPSHMSPGCFSVLPPGGTQYAVTCLTLRNLIQMAYGTSYIEGGGKELEAQFDVRASTGETPWTQESIQPMMRQLLVQRFHLAVHEGKRDVSGYRLVVAKGGSKLQTVSPESIPKGQRAGEGSANVVYAGGVQGLGVDASYLAVLLSTALHAPVADDTGLKGVFNIDLKYAPDNSTDSDLPSFFTAVEEQLGLKLQPGKVTVDTLVIDHVDAEPTPN